MGSGQGINIPDQPTVVAQDFHVLDFNALFAARLDLCHRYGEDIALLLLEKGGFFPGLTGRIVSGPGLLLFHDFAVPADSIDPGGEAVDACSFRDGHGVHAFRFPVRFVPEGLGYACHRHLIVHGHLHVMLKNGKFTATGQATHAGSRGRGCTDGQDQHGKG